MNKEVLLNLSIFKTLRFNIAYFGWRGIIYPRVFISRSVCLNNLSGKVLISEDIPIGGIKIGFGYVGIIDRKREKSLWENTGCIEFHGRADFGIRTRIACNGHLIIGKNVRINAGTDIICWKKISIGDECLVSWDTLFIDSDFHKIFRLGIDDIQLNIDEEISIGNHVWIGCRCTILKGSSIPEKSVVAAGSVIRRKFISTNSIYYNNECIKNDIEWQL